MSDNLPSSVDGFLDDIEDEAINGSEIDSETASKPTSLVDSRRRLEARLAERSLARDIKEFDFRF
ncbi:MAG: hypothetical protein ACJAUP_003211 [Cellvibrionaceae bacterium]|jgi:hypothetical protein